MFQIPWSFILRFIATPLLIKIAGSAKENMKSLILSLIVNDRKFSTSQKRKKDVQCGRNIVLLHY